jgi:uncharacterized membrane protein
VINPPQDATGVDRGGTASACVNPAGTALAVSPRLRLDADLPPSPWTVLIGRMDPSPPSVDDAGASRIDAFTDAAFAFAVTLLVIGGGEAPNSFDGLRQAIWSIPVFAVGFALIAMFWHAHLRWRRLCGSGDTTSVLLTFGLIFLVLVYVYPLRIMAASMVDYFRGQPAPLGETDLAGLFTIYGLGFAAMSAAVLCLFATGLRRVAAGPARAAVIGECAIWAMLGGSGLLSALLAQFAVTAPASPWVYSALPVAIGVFVAWHDWQGAQT